MLLVYHIICYDVCLCTSSCHERFMIAMSLTCYVVVLQVLRPQASGTASMQQHSSLCQRDSPCQTRWSSEQHAAFGLLARGCYYLQWRFLSDVVLMLSTSRSGSVNLCWVGQVILGW